MKNFKEKIKQIKLLFSSLYVSCPDQKKNIDELANSLSDILKDVYEEKQQLENIDISNRKRKLSFNPSNSWCSLCNSNPTKVIEIKTENSDHIICLCFSCIDSIFSQRQQ